MTNEQERERARSNRSRRHRLMVILFCWEEHRRVNHNEIRDDLLRSVSVIQVKDQMHG